MSLPPAIAELLWSYDPSRIDPDVDIEVVVAAVLRLGSWDQIKWLFSHYGRSRVVSVIEEDYFGCRSLPVSIRAFWGKVFWPGSPPPELIDPRERWRPTRSRVIEDRVGVEVRRRLEAALTSSGLTQKGFARLLGTSQPRLSSYLSGKVVPSAAFLVRAEHVADSLHSVP